MLSNEKSAEYIRLMDSWRARSATFGEIEDEIMDLSWPLDEKEFVFKLVDFLHDAYKAGRISDWKPKE